MPLEELKNLRATLTELSARVDHVDVTLRAGFEKRDRARTRAVRVVAGVAVLLFCGLLIVAMSFLSYRDAQAEDARAACERGNDSTEVDRQLIVWQFEDYNLAPANQTAERQAFLRNRLRQRLEALEELRPIRDCDDL